MTAPTPAELRELAARARALALAISDAHHRLRQAADEPTRRAGFRLVDAAGEIRLAGDQLSYTADDVARVRGRGSCPADWGVCPDHGATLRSSAGRCWCIAPGCGRSWGYDRVGLPCAEPVAFEVRHAAGGGGPMCSGHALAARDQLIDAVVSALPAAGAR